MMALERLDLNLLKVFSALYEDRNVTLAGHRLGLAQSSMSHALRRLRQALGDPLFVRAIQGVLPTPYATAIAQPINAILRNIDDVIQSNREFLASKSSRMFNLIMSDIAETFMLPTIAAHLATHAPSVRLKVVKPPSETFAEDLYHGGADLAFGLLPAADHGLFQQVLLDVKVECFMRRSHPASGHLSLEDFLRLPQLVVSPPAMAELQIRHALGKQASERNIAVQIRSYGAAPFIVSSTDLIAALPIGVGAPFLDTDLVRKPLPFPVAPIVVRQFWHERTHEDPGCKWLRHAIASLFGTTAAVTVGNEEAQN